MERKFQIQQKVRAAKFPESVGFVVSFFLNEDGSDFVNPDGMPWYKIQWIEPRPSKRQLPEPESYLAPFKLDKAARFRVA